MKKSIRCIILSAILIGVMLVSFSMAIGLAVQPHSNSKVNGIAYASRFEESFSEKGIGYFSTYGVDETISINNVTENIGGEKISLSASLQKDYVPLATLSQDDMQVLYTFTETGKYSLMYYYCDNSGRQTIVKEYEFTVNLQPYIDVVFAPKYKTDSSVEIQKPCKQGNTVVDSVVEIKTPSGEKRIVTSDTLTFDENGIWEITYSAKFGGRNISRTYCVCVDGRSDRFSDYFTPINGISEIRNDMPSPSYAREGKGVGIIVDESGTFRFNNVIDVNSLTREKNLIKLLPLSEGGYQNVKELSVKLIDVYDTSNFIKMIVYSRIWDPVEWVYCNLEYKATQYATNDKGEILIDPYTGLGTNVQFDGALLKQAEQVDGAKHYGDAAWFEAQFDPMQKQFFVYAYVYEGGHQNKQMLLADLDDPKYVGYGNEWSGFATGEVYLEVEIKTAGTGGVIVQEICGEKLFGEEKSTETPSLFFAEEQNGLFPTGKTGEFYPLPEPAYSVDVIDGKRGKPDYEILKVEKEIIENVRYETVSDFSRDGFVPSSAGNYRVVYGVTDRDGNTGTSAKKLSVQDTFGDKTVPIDLPEKFAVGETFTIPEIVPNGLSRLVKSEVSVRYLGQEYSDCAGESIFLKEAGEIVVEYLFRDYFGDTLQDKITVPVVVQDKPIVTVNGTLPKYAIKGSTIVLPGLNAVNYAKIGTDEFNVPWTLEASGDTVDVVSRQLTIDKEHGETIDIVYKVNGVIIHQAEITVVDAQYLGDRFYAISGSISTNNTESHVEIVTGADAKIDFINPFIFDSETKTFPVVIDIPDDKANFSHIDLYFEDYLDESIRVFLRLTHEGYGKVFAQLNGQGGKIALEKTEDGTYGFSYNILRKMFESSARIVLKNKVDGTEFTGFSSNRMSLRIAFSGVTAQSELHVYRLGNLYFQSELDGNVDNLVPVLISKQSYLENSFMYGTEICVPAMEARTELSGLRPASVTIIAPSGKKIVDNENGYNEYRFLAEEYGIYKIEYTIPFRNSVWKKNYTFRVHKESLPEISIESSSAEYRNGDTLTLPTVAVTNTDGNYEVEYAAICPNGKVVLLQTGETVKLDQNGLWLLQVTVSDGYNIVSETLRIHVRG